MADSLTDIVVGLQRMAEGARLRGDDLRYIQQRETDEHVLWLNQLLDMVEKVRSVLIEERQAFAPQRERVAQQPQMQAMPRVVKQGPKEVAGMTFDGLPRGHYGAILADPPWHFQTWKGAFSDASVSGKRVARTPDYGAMREDDISALPVDSLAAADCILFLWVCWPVLEQALRTIEAWDFKFKTAAFVWTKAHAGQLEMFAQEIPDQMGMGYWTRANTEPCLLATRGRPKRLNADVRQAIIAPRREHSRKPDGIHERIERLVAGPYLELFARQRRPGWDCWGNEVDKFAPQQAPAAQQSWAEMWAKPFDFSQEPTS